MRISKKWRPVAAGVIVAALVGGGATAANAADSGDTDILNPQSNGSIGSFYIWDGNTGENIDDGRSYGRADALIISSSKTDVLAEIMPPAAGTWDQAWKFVAKASEMTGGTGSWRAYSPTFAAGPAGGILVDDFTLESKINQNAGGIETVFTEGGEWYAGVAFTTNAGVTPVKQVYRTIHVDAATDTFTVDAVEVSGPPAADLIVESELVAPETATVTTTVDSTDVSVDAGIAHAGQTLNVGAFASGARVDLGTVTLDAAGVGTVTATEVPLNVASKLFLYTLDGSNNEILAGWGAFTLTQSQITTDTTNLTATVTNSGKFSIIAPAQQTIDLGEVRRNRVTTPVALGAVTVFDDRDVLSGWNLNITSTAFAGPGATTVPALALGYAPTGTTLYPGITAGAAKAAGEGAFGVLAEGAAGSATGEFDGAVIDTDLTFKAPINAAKGVHTATLTLDLVSK